MKKGWWILIGLTVLATATIVASPAIREEINWKWALYKAGPGSFAGYIAAWPNGSHAEEARALLDEKSWETATAQNTIESYDLYLKTLPDGKHVSEALSKKEEKTWARTISLDTAPAYGDYVSKYPEGRFSIQAKEKLDDKSWDEAQNSGSIDFYKKYLEDFPEGRHRDEAKLGIEDLDWKSTLASNTVAAYRGYLERNPAGRYSEQAKSSIENVDWNSVVAMNTVAGYHDYLERNPTGRYSEQARSKLKAMLQDDSFFQAAQKQGTRQAMEQFLAQFPGHVREKDARSALKDLEGRNITELIANKKIEIKAEGSGIQDVSLSIRRLVSHPIKVIIPVGTFFVAKKGSVQDMVTRQESDVILSNDSWYYVNISSACANRPREIPQGGDSFSAQISPNSKDLEKLMPELRKARADYAAEQAAIWIVTDNATYSDLGILVSRSVYQMFGGERVIQEIHAAQAMKICENAGINITKKAIWRDRELILRGIKDENLKSWIRERARRN